MSDFFLGLYCGQMVVDDNKYFYFDKNKVNVRFS